jgi:hypothetical protein
MKKLLIIAALFFLSNAKSNAQDSCKCLLNFNHYVDKVANNYAGFKDKVNPRTEKTYNLMVDSLRKVAENTKLLRGCYDVLEKYRLFFYDKHLQLNANLPPEPVAPNAPVASNAPTQTMWTKDLIVKDLEKRKNALNPMEGIWNTEGYQVGVVFNEKEKRYDGVILEAGNPKWKVGMVKFSSKMMEPTVYEMVYVRGDFALDTMSSKVLKNYLVVPKYGTWKRSFPVSRDTLTDLDAMAELGDVQFKFLNDTTLYIALKSCDMSNKPILDTLMARNAERLKKTPYWIVDFRNNNGGSTDVYSSLLPYLYTKTLISKGNKRWMSPENTQKLKAYMVENQKVMDAETYKYIKNMVEFGEKNPNGWFNDNGDTTKFDKMLPFPKKVDVLTNENNGSSGETFLIVARGLSDKVTIFGENSAGYLDYGDIMPYTMPCENFQINIPARRANYLDYGVSYDKTGYPPDVYIPKTNKDWLKFVKDYWAKNPKR